MNIKELQQEVANLGTQLLTLSDRIQSLQVTGTAEETTCQQQNFQKINQLAKQYPIHRDVLVTKDEIVKKEYLRGLMQFVIGCEESVYEGLLYVTRIANGINMKITAEEIYASSVAVTVNEVANTYEALTTVKYIFLTDALVVAHLYPGKQEIMIELMADAFAILGIDLGAMKIITTMAKAIATEDWDILGTTSFVNLLIDNQKCIPEFSNVVSLTWLETQRVPSGAALLRKGGLVNTLSILSLVDDWTFVKAKTILLKGEYIVYFGNKPAPIQFVAETSGMLYHTMGENLGKGHLWRVFYICHPFDSYNAVRTWSDSQQIKAWDKILKETFTIKINPNRKLNK